MPEVSTTIQTPPPLVTTLTPPAIILTTLQVAQGPAGVPGVPVVQVTLITYDVLDRVISYLQDGVAHVVTYPDPNTIVDTGGGYVRTVTLDLLKRPVSLVVTTI